MHGSCARRRQNVLRREFVSSLKFRQRSHRASASAARAVRSCHCRHTHHSRQMRASICSVRSSVRHKNLVGIVLSEISIGHQQTSLFGMTSSMSRISDTAAESRALPFHAACAARICSMPRNAVSTSLFWFASPQNSAFARCTSFARSACQITGHSFTQRGQRVLLYPSKADPAFSNDRLSSLKHGKIRRRSLFSRASSDSLRQFVQTPSDRAPLNLQMGPKPLAISTSTAVNLRIAAQQEIIHLFRKISMQFRAGISRQRNTVFFMGSVGRNLAVVAFGKARFGNRLAAILARPLAQLMAVRPALTSLRARAIFHTYSLPASPCAQLPRVTS